MKKIIFIVFFLTINIIVQSQSLLSTNEMDKSKVFVRVGKLTPQIYDELKNFGEIIDSQEEVIKVKNLSKEQPTIDINWIVLSSKNLNLDEIKELSFVDFASFFIKTSSKSITETGLLYVKTNINNVQTLIENFEQKYSLRIVDVLGYEKNVLKILIDKSNNFSLEELTRLIEEESGVMWTQIGYLYDIEKTCTTDPLFNNQWGLNNTGQNGGTAGVDINFCDAMNITMGDPNITVAVVDEGVDLTHPDLEANIINGFDATGNGSNGGHTGNEDHGTNCAGIIGAVSNNGEGMAGIASNSRIMPCRMRFRFAQTSEWLADCINFAWQNGADVISNSWVGGSNNNNINQAITNAINNGRNGLGCVVVFSSGNSDGAVAYPANSNPAILAVGAVDRCGIRSGRIDVIPNSCDPWCPACLPASQFGPELDIVAPGTSVMTTDLQGTGNTNFDYDNNYGGTSAAAPHVAGVAALILSINPCLTDEEVSRIIEYTAQKTGGYGYVNNANRPNGTWHQEVRLWFSRCFSVLATY